MRSVAALALALAVTTAVAQTYQPPRHTLPPPPGLVDGTPLDVLFRADAGTQVERNRSPAGELAEHRKLERALAALAPQRKGVVDAYVVSIALDSDPVFGREAREAGAVLQRRYGAAGRTIVLAGSDGSGPSALARGTPGTLAVALARIAELIDKGEDAIVLYTTSHGAPFGLYYHDADQGYGSISPNRLGAMLDELAVFNRLLILSACFSGGFVQRLQSPSAVIVTASSSDRTSFGCAAENDWTYFGDALINRALRKPQPLAAAFAEAGGLVAAWEARSGVPPSQPQLSIGANVARWLDPLERRVPKAATQPVGRPAFDPSRPSRMGR
jgi:Peptidase C13 family